MARFTVGAFVEALTSDLMTKVGPEMEGLVVSSGELREGLLALQDEIQVGVEKITTMAHPGAIEAAALDRAVEMRTKKVMDVLRGSVLCSAGTRATVGALLESARRTVAVAARSFR
jgi:sulfate adenylyltransferase subunit 1 (EFTu-like GTPase family)